MRKIIIIVLSIFLTFPLFAQVKFDLSTFRYPFSNRAKCDSIVTAVNDAFNNYVEYATLLDDERGMVNTKATNRFSNLFVNGKSTAIYGDLLKRPERIRVTKYIEIGNFKLKRTGVKFKINKVTISSLDEHPYDKNTFIVMLNVEKVMLNGWDNTKSEVITEVREFPKPLVFTYEVPKSDYSLAKISSIKGESCSIIRTRFNIEPYLSAGVVTLDQTANKFWSDNFGDNTLSPALQIGGGALFRGNFGDGSTLKEKLYWVIGAEFSLTSITNKIENYQYNFDSPDPDGDLYQRNVNVVLAEEKINLSAISGQIGLGYTIYNGYRMSIILDALFIPTYYIGAKSKFAGNVSYQGRYNQHNFDFSNITDPNPEDDYDPVEDLRRIYGIGDFTKTDEDLKIDASLQYSVRISPKILWTLRDNIGLVISAHYTLGLNDVLGGGSKTDNFLQFPTTYNTANPVLLDQSLTQNYFEKLGLSSIGGQIGIFYKFEKEKLDCPY